MITKEEIIAFEKEIAEVFATGVIRAPVHLRSGREDELIRAIRLPRTTANWKQHLRKVGTRKAQAISKVCIAAMAEVEGGTIRNIRIAFGSVAPTPVRATKTEAILKGQLIDEAAIKAARAELLNELKPIDDVRSTADYRSQVAANLLEEFLSGLK